MGGRRGSIAAEDEPLERDRRIRELERHLPSAGLPLLAEQYSATEDVDSTYRDELIERLRSSCG